MYILLFDGTAEPAGATSGTVQPAGRPSV